MRRKLIWLAAAVLALALTSPAHAGIVKVAKRLNVVTFFGGYAHPVGSYNGIDVIDFIDSGGRLANLDAGDVYDPGFYFGLGYGQIRNDHILFNLSFRWIHINTEDTFWVDPFIGYTFYPQTPAFNQYDLDFDLNWLFVNPSYSLLSPYLGLGFHAGITSASGEFIETENDVTLALGLNFGADLAVWRAGDNRSVITVSSVNEWIVAASDKRPRYLNLGAAVKYYFRP
ncbi:MAG: hypothetical protein JSW34_01290 [Candidatus Zixiibacteriota bacterium]|nr:MAG: hypothetical protein JSW34_01290 [candidate division Zixibacteria bacterium]